MNASSYRPVTQCVASIRNTSKYRVAARTLAIASALPQEGGESFLSVDTAASMSLPASSTQHLHFHPIGHSAVTSSCLCGGETSDSTASGICASALYVPWSDLVRQPFYLCCFRITAPVEWRIDFFSQRFPFTSGGRWGCHIGRVGVSSGL